MSEIRVFKPTDLSKKDWNSLHKLSWVACMESFKEGYNARAFVDLDDFERFRESHINPNLEVGRRFNANQEYHRPRVAVAYDGGKPISWAFSQRNVSGGGPAKGPHSNSLAARGARLLKRASSLSPVSEGAMKNKNYLQLREDYTRRKWQRTGVARDVAIKLLDDAMPWQPVAIYEYPDIYKEEFESPVARAKRLGFFVTGEVETQVDWASEPVKMVRLEANHVHVVMKRLESVGGEM